MTLRRSKKKGAYSMCKQMKCSILAIALLVSLGVSTKAIDETDFSGGTAIVESTSDEKIINIRYSNITETEEGNFLFTLVETVPSARNMDNVQYRQAALVVPYSEEYRDELRTIVDRKTAAPRATITIDDEKVDTSQSFTFFMTVKFQSRQENSGITYARVVSANGGYYSQGGNYVGSGMYVRSHKVEMHTWGGRLGDNGDNETIMQSKTETPTYTSNTWSYNAPSDWVDVFYLAGGYHDISARYSVVAGRGSQGTAGNENYLTISLP